MIALAAGALYQFQNGGFGLRLPQIGSGAGQSAHFTLCALARTGNCVIDGDTFDFRGERIRVMDIDAPETHPPRCDYEADLGERATNRLRELLNEGPFVLAQSSRDVDQYGRKLRVVRRNGHSLGAVLVNEGLARRWTGRRQPWCGVGHS